MPMINPCLFLCLVRKLVFDSSLSLLVVASLEASRLIDPKAFENSLFIA
uniref:Uncharacterized protein n=1 Tax=Arundo donax TaxID=35708 RepID=A0A0A9U2V0_ARUDO